MRRSIRPDGSHAPSRGRFCPEPNLVFADRTGRIVTAGGTTSWDDLAIHIISRHCSPVEALRIAGQAPRDLASLVPGTVGSGA